MKRLLLFLALLVPSVVFAQNSAYQSILLGPSGRPLAGAVVTVCSSSGIGIPCSPTVNIFNSAGAGISNPTFSDGRGNLEFWAPAGTYIYTVTGSGITPYTQVVVLPCIVGTACGIIGPYTIATLPASTTNTIAVVTDGNGVNCTTGGGTTRQFCQWNGSSWLIIGGGGTSITLQTNGVNNTSQAALNLQTSTANTAGLAVTPSNPSAGNEKIEVSGTLAHASLPALVSGDIPNNAANTSGTAAALGTTPTNCGAGIAAIGVLANGNATGCFTPLTTPPCTATANSLQYNNAGVFGCIPTGLTGQPYVATNGAAAAPASPGIADGNAGAPVTTTPYTILCDSATALRDRSTTIRFQTGASVVTAPDHTASGCGSNMSFVLINEAGPLTVNRSGSDTFSVYGIGSIPLTGQTSFVLPTNSTVTLSNGAGTVWEARNTVAQGAIATLEAAFPTTLMADYRMLATETPASLVDYSGNGRNATGTTGTAPTIISVSGGISCPGTGNVVLPASLNSALTILAYIDFQSVTAQPASNTSAPTIVGGGAIATSTNWELYNNPITDGGGNEIQGGYRFRSTASGGGWHTASSAAFNGSGVVGFVMGATDLFYINGQPINMLNIGGVSAGQQTVGPYNICGTSVTNYFNGNIRQMAFFSTALNAAQVATATQIMQNQMIARGVTPFLGGSTTDVADQVVLIGDSLTAGTNWPISLLSFPVNVADQGLGGFTTSGLLGNAPYDFSTLYRQGALRNAMTYWAGTNNASNPTGAIANMRSELQTARNVGFRTVIATMISRTGEEVYRDSLNPLILQNWPLFTDGIVCFSCNVHFGADNAFSNTTYYNVDGVHLTAFSDNYLIGPYFVHGINRAYGNTLQSGNYNRYTGTGFSIPTPLQTADSGCTALSGATVVCATPFNVTAGNFLKATINCENCTGVTINVPTGGGTWNAVSAQVAVGTAVQRSFYLMNATGGATTLSETFTGGTPANVYIKVSEFSGVATAGALDVASAWASGSSAAPASAAITTTQAGDLIVSDGGGSGVLGTAFAPTHGTQWIPLAGYTQLTTDYNAYEAYSVAGAAGSYTGSATLNVSMGWQFQTAAFKAVAGASIYQIQDVDIYATCVPNGTNNVGLNLPDGAWMAGQTLTIHNEQATGAATCDINGTTPYATGVNQPIDGQNSIRLGNGDTVELKSALTYTGVAGTNQSPVINWTREKGNNLPGSPCANGNFALSAGWGTTATVTAAAGFAQNCQVTITSSGTGQAANPTITDTLASALSTSTTLCSAQMVGGTGANTLINQTALSATVPVFTFGGTPVAASTYFIVVRCGP